MKRIHIFTALCFAVTLLAASPAFASRGGKLTIENADCSESSGTSAAFYKFDKIIIYLQAGDPKTKEYKKNYPEEFYYSALKSRAEEAIKKVLATCLKKTFGGNKPIETYNFFNAGMYDPDNLVFNIQLSYVGKYTEDKSDDNRALLVTKIFRAGVSDEDALRIFINKSRHRQLYLDGRPVHYDEGIKIKSLAEQLDDVFAESFTPTFVTGTPTF
jgi:hypothetical protein